MAAIWRLFSGKRTVEESGCPSRINASWSPGEFNVRRQVRVLICQESDSKGKIVLYDSFRLPCADEAEEEEQSAPRPNASAGSRAPARKHVRGTGGTDLLAEMMFGVTPMVVAETGSKMHRIPDPHPQFLITKVFGHSCLIPATYEKRERSDEDQARGGVMLPPRNHRSNFAVGVAVSAAAADETAERLQHFILSHYALIESHIAQLLMIVRPLIQNSLEQYVKETQKLRPGWHLAALSLQERYDALESAVTWFRVEIAALFTTPRILEPHWLTIVQFPSRRGQATAAVIRDLHFLITNHNGPKSNLFVTGFITAILSSFLAWVPTVMPADKACELPAPPSVSCLESQLRQSYGVERDGASCCRVIVAGKKKEVVERLLLVATYFMRSSEVVERFEEMESLKDLENERAPGQEESPDASVASHVYATCEPLSPMSTAVLSAKLCGSGADLSLETPPSRKRRSAAEIAAEIIASPSESFLPIPRAVNIRRVPKEEIDLQPGETIDVEAYHLKSLARSLCAGYCENYRENFALIGVDTDDALRTVHPRLSHEFTKMEALHNIVKPGCPFPGTTHVVVDLNRAHVEYVRHEVESTTPIEMPLAASEAAPASDDVAGDGEWIAKITSMKETRTPVRPSNHVHATLQGAEALCALGLPPDSVISYLEERLRELAVRAMLAVAVVNELFVGVPLDRRELAEHIGMDESDMDIVLSVASLFDSSLNKSVVPATLPVDNLRAFVL